MAHTALALEPGLSEPAVSSDDLRFRYAHLYRDAPSTALGRLRKIWERQRGSLIEAGGELYCRMTALSLCLRIQPDVIAWEGATPTDFASSEGSLWKAIVSVNFHVVLLDMASDKLLAKQHFFWIQTVIDLSATISILWRRERRPRELLSQAQAEQYFSRLPVVWDTLRANAPALLSNEETIISSRLAGSIIEFAYCTMILYKRYYTEYCKRLPEISSILTVSLSAWTYVATCSDASDQVLPEEQHYLPFRTVTFYRDCMFDAAECAVTERQIGEAWRAAVDESTGSLKFFRACCDALSSWPAMVNNNLKGCLEGLQYIVAYNGIDHDDPVHRETLSRRAYWDVPIIHSVAEALERESRSDVQHLTPTSILRTRASICESGCHLLQFNLEAFVNRVGQPPVMDGRSAYKILSASLLMLGQILEMLLDLSGEPNTGIVRSAVKTFVVTCNEWRSICVGGLGAFGQLKGGATAKFTSGVNGIALRRIAHGTQDAAREAWYKDMYALRARRARLAGDNDYESLVQAWQAFGDKLGFEETAERDRHEAGSRHMCGWVLCKYHLRACPTKLSACAGCDEQRYCSRECQKSDWKRGGHRSKCRRLDASGRASA